MQTHLFFTLVALFLPIFAFGISDDDFFKIQRGLRQLEMYDTKTRVAEFDANQSLPTQKNNGDEKRYADKRGSFNKGLLHEPSGFPNVDAFNSLVKALQTGKQSDFDTIRIGIGEIKLVNPQASFAFSLAGNDGCINAIPPAPTFSSAETAGEMVELYWSALVRDVNFNDFDTDATVATAVASLNTLSDFRGPKIGGQVTSGTFLRGSTPGDLVGPYISQFLFQNIPFGNNEIDATTLETPIAGNTNDFLSSLSDWVLIQNGGFPTATITFDASTHFIRTPRDLAEYVHQDTPGQTPLGALLLLSSYGDAALDPNNPYLNNPTQQGFVTFNISQVLYLMRVATHEALKAAWYHKWQVNRRLRPEEYGFYVQQQVINGQELGIHPDLTGSDALPAIASTFGGSLLLPIAYPEGSPVHPSFPAGHAVVIGATVTILKAFFNEDFSIPNPLQPNGANTSLVSFPGTLKVGGELNKLAANISLGRDHAGVHYRSDGFQGIALGEKIAIDVLNNNAFLFHEDFAGFHLTKFDGTQILVGGKR